MAKRVVDVLVPVALDRAYSYRVPDTLTLAPGDIVSVPLGAREATGVVWTENPKPDIRLDNRLKDIDQKLEFPPLKPELRTFVDWVANYTVKGETFVADKPRVWFGKQLANIGLSPNFDLVPDGKRFAVLMPAQSAEPRETQSHVTLALNFFDEVRRRTTTQAK